MLDKILSLKKSDFKDNLITLKYSNASYLDNFFDHLNQDIIASYLIKKYLGGLSDSNSMSVLNKNLDVLNFFYADLPAKIRNEVFIKSWDIVNSSEFETNPKLNLYALEGCQIDKSFKSLITNLKSAPVDFYHTFLFDKIDSKNYKKLVKDLTPED